jgi:hypothetical protein
MATISFAIPDDVLPRVLDAFAEMYGYQDQVSDPANPGEMIPNPQTKAQFARRKIIDYVREMVRVYEGSVAKASAEAKSDSEVSVS